MKNQTAVDKKGTLARLTRLAVLCALMCAALSVGAFAVKGEDKVADVVKQLNDMKFAGASNYSKGFEYELKTDDDRTCNGHKYSEPYYQYKDDSGTWYYFEWVNDVTFDDEKKDLQMIFYFTDANNQVHWTNVCEYINRNIRYCLDYDEEGKHYAGNKGETNAFFVKLPENCKRVVAVTVIKADKGTWATSYMHVAQSKYNAWNNNPRNASVIKYSAAYKYRNFEGTWVAAWAPGTKGADMRTALNKNEKGDATFMLTGNGSGATGGSSKHTYCMYEIVTGNNRNNIHDGTITLTYTDYMGIDRTVKTNLKDGYKIACGDKEDFAVKNLTGAIKLNDWSAADAMSMQNAAALVTHNLYGETALDEGVLKANAATHVMFDATEDIVKVKSIYLDVSDSLEIKAVRLIAPTGGSYLGNIYWNANYGSERLREFNGRLLAELNASNTVSRNITFAPTEASEKRRLTVYESGKGPAYNTKSSMVGVSIQIADLYNAGVDELMARNATASNFWDNLDPCVEECFTLKLEYKDVKGVTRTVEVPVLTTYICQLIFQDSISKYRLSDHTGLMGTQVSAVGLVGTIAEKEAKKDWISGLMRQDDNVGLALRLSEFKELVSLNFTYGVKPSGLTYTTTEHTQKDGCDSKTTVTDDVRRINTDKDVIAIENICFYTGVNSTNFKNSYDAKSLGVKFTTTLTPQYSYSAASKNGVRFAKNGALSLKAGQGNFRSGKPAAREDTERYLVRFENSKFGMVSANSLGIPDPSGLFGDQGVRYSIAYTTNDGAQHTTTPTSMIDVCANYYGISYLGAAQGEQYMKHMNSKTTEFVVELKDVKSFDAITVTLQDTSTQWQFKSVELLKLSSLGPRTTADGRESTGAIIWLRDAAGTRMAYAHKAILLQKNNSTRTVNFSAFDETGEPIKKEEQKKNESYLDTLPEEMTYKDTLKDLGLSVPKYNYMVNVDVADVDDAGSSNYFYFQLCFENGESGVVLANQQLASDSFRQGTTESFQIKTAQNYGKLTSVRIICDNATSTSNVFDKLNIDKIAVTLSGTSGVSRSWIVERVGWIDITYTEEGENEVINEFGSAEADGKVKNVEIVKEFEVTKTATAVDLLFAVKTGKDNTKTNGNAMITPNVDATLIYYDGEGNERTLAFNMNDKIKAYNDTDDQSSIFRASHIDRFILPLTDVSSIQAMYLRLGTTSFNAAGSVIPWSCGEISISQISGVGDVYISETQEEYYRDIDKETFLASSTNEDGATYELKPDGEVTVTFTENSISVSGKAEDVNNWDTTITSVPKTRNDTLNIYLFPGVALGQQTKFDTSHPGVTVTVKYSTVFGGKPVASAFPDVTNYQTLSDGTTVLYREKMDVKGFSTLNSIMVSSKSANGAQPYIGKMIVEHVRSGVLMETFCIDYGGFYLGNGNPDISPSANVKVSPMHQTLQMQVAPNQAAALTAKTSDILVALRYVSALDASGKMVYRTPYTYLTEANITSLSYGKSVTVPFSVGNIGRVVGLSVISSGPTVEFERALIANYAGEAGDDNILLSTCSIKEGFVSSSMRIDKTANNTDTVTPVTFTFVTGAETTYPGAGAQGQINMDVCCVDGSGKEVTVPVADIAKYLPAGETFDAGTTKSISLLLPNIDYVKSVDLSTDDDWFLSSVTATTTPLGGTPLSATKSVNNHVSKDNPLKVDVTPTSKGGTAEGNEILSFTVKGTASVSGTSASATSTSATGMREIEISAYEGDTIKIEPSIKAVGTPDMTWKWFNADELYITADGKSATFTVPAGTAANSKFDLGSVRCNGDSRLTIGITVKVVEKPKPQEKRESSSESSETSNSQQQGGESQQSAAPQQQSGGESQQQSGGTP